MSKQSTAKAAQGYDPKPIMPYCINCRHFSSEITIEKGRHGGEFKRESTVRCAFGGFAIKKLGTCNFFLNAPGNDPGNL